MALQPMPEGRQTLPSVTDEPLSAALPVLLARRAPTTGALAGLLRAEGIAISRTRLHQLLTGSGAPPTPEQLERLASVLGVSAAYFAEYRLWRVRALLDPGIVGFDRAMANFGRLRGGRALGGAGRGHRSAATGRCRRGRNKPRGRGRATSRRDRPCAVRAGRARARPEGKARCRIAGRGRARCAARAVRADIGPAISGERRRYRDRGRHSLDKEAAEAVTEPHGRCFVVL